MRAQLEVHTSEPDQPERATLELTRGLLARAPRQRAITLALVGLAPAPGLTPTPWALDGVLEACVEAERTPVHLLTLGDAATGEALLRKATRALLGGVDGDDLVERPSRDRSLSLRNPGQARPFTLPREVVGSSLILVTPLLLRAHDQGRVGQPRHWHGPLALTLEQLALAWGFVASPPKLSSGLRPRPDEDGREVVAAGLELLAASFATVSVIVDGTWAGALEPVRTPSGGRIPGGGGIRGADGRFARAFGVAPTPTEPPRLLGELASPDRCLAITGVEALELDAVLGVDQWLGRVLGLNRREPTLPAPNLGARSPGRWPSIEINDVRPSQPTRLADRAISGIRSQSQRISAGLGLAPGPARESIALPARVGGRFAQQWTSRWYTEHERLPR